VVACLDGPSVVDRARDNGNVAVRRFHHTGVYDPVRDRMIVFGGTTGARLNDRASLDLGVLPAQ
jgi:hypothetical protein